MSISPADDPLKESAGVRVWCPISIGYSADTSLSPTGFVGITVRQILAIQRYFYLELGIS